MSEETLRAEAESLYVDWHEEQFEESPSAVRVRAKHEETPPHYHADFVEQAFVDAFVLGVECGANASQPDSKTRS